MCKALPATLTLEGLWSLDREKARALVRKVVSRYPRALTEGQILRRPATWLLAALLEPDLPPGDTSASPSEILAWLGSAASKRSKDPAGYVWGRLRNERQSAARRRGREQEHGAEMAEFSIEARLVALDGWSTLSEQEQRWVADAIEVDSRAELARQWGLTLNGTKDRLKALRKKIKNF